MNKLIRRAIFSKEKKIAGYFYFLSNSKKISVSGESSIYPIMRELLYESSLTGQKKIFVCITQKDLEEKIYPLLPVDKTIIGVTEIINNEKLKEVMNFGYKTMIEVEDFEENIDAENLEYISFIRCNISNEKCKEIVELYKKLGKQIIIEGINTEKLYAKAEKLNPDFYEGIAVAQQMAQITTGDNFLSTTISKLEENLNKENYNVEDIYNVFKTDSKLVATLLRLVNAMGYSNTHHTLTIKEAIETIGKEKMRYVIALVSQGKTDDETFTNILKMDLYRAIFIEELNKNISPVFLKRHKISRLSSEDAYIIGLFSDIDILNNKSMKDTLINLNQSRDVEDALVYKEGLGGTLLKLVYAYNGKDADKVNKYAVDLGLKVNKIDEIYTIVLHKVNETWREIHEKS